MEGGPWRGEFHCLSHASFSSRPSGHQCTGIQVCESCDIKKTTICNYHYAIKEGLFLTLRTFGGTESQNKWRILIKYNIVLHFLHVTMDHRTKANIFCRSASGKQWFCGKNIEFGSQPDHSGIIE